MAITPTGLGFTFVYIPRCPKARHLGASGGFKEGLGRQPVVCLIVPDLAGLSSKFRARKLWLVKASLEKFIRLLLQLAHHAGRDVGAVLKRARAKGKLKAGAIGAISDIPRDSPLGLAVGAKVAPVRQGIAGDQLPLSAKVVGADEGAGVVEAGHSRVSVGVVR